VRTGREEIIVISTSAPADIRTARKLRWRIGAVAVLGVVFSVSAVAAAHTISVATLIALMFVSLLGNNGN
jgi:hypothetical protein